MCEMLGYSERKASKSMWFHRPSQVPLSYHSQNLGGGWAGRHDSDSHLDEVHGRCARMYGVVMTEIPSP